MRAPCTRYTRRSAYCCSPGSLSLSLSPSPILSCGVQTPSWRQSPSVAHSSVLPQLPSVPGALPAPGALAPTTVTYAHQQFINQDNESSSRVRAQLGGPPASHMSATGYVQAAPPVQAKFHRARSSFIANKWTRGPGDGTFGSIYLSYGGHQGGGEFGSRNFGGGPNLSFDRKRPEELWEEEQQRKRAATAPSKKKKSTTNKKGGGKGGKADTKKKPSGRDAQARRMLTRARNQLLAFLSAPSCRLFSDADHVVAVSDDDLDDLLRAGGGDSSKVLAHLAEFDRSNQKYDNFAQLMAAIQEARKAHGDFGAGTDEQPTGYGGEGGEEQQHQQEEEKTADADADAAHTQRSDDYVQEPETDADASPAGLGLHAYRCDASMRCT